MTTTNEALSVERIEEILAEAAIILDTDREFLDYTRDTMDMFFAQWGFRKPAVGESRMVCDWSDLQPGGKGTPRITLTVVDMGPIRVCRQA